ncbi:cytochrome c biogenesis CcdA family protein [Spirillospora sp. CA-294931]|uniref:cytochrome c biogenesis CcdA family protein n=1 Tax=Spirillospora sp. CA-294931 TaxID=3240042 RepID=UPI003D8DBA95
METVSLALAAGLVAAFNPCGFALLPTYLALLVAEPGSGGVWRALRLSAAMTGGFVTVFGVFGGVVAVAATSVQEHLPWVTIVIGVGLLGLGIWLVSGRELLVRLPRLGVGGADGSLVALYGYGASYAVASLSCTIAPFLAVTGIVSGGGLAEGVLAFAAYGVGMGLVVGLLSMMVALARGAAVARLRRVLPHVSRASGVLLFLAGMYVVYYGWYELRVYAGREADDPVVDAATRVQGAVTGFLDDLGPGLVAAGFAAVALVAAVSARRARAARVKRGTGRDGDKDRVSPPR